MKDLDQHTITEIVRDLPRERLIQMLIESQEQIQNLGATYRSLMKGEPVFMLRARDILAPDTVRFWAGQITMIQGEGSLKAREALQLANDMEAWQQSQARKIPD